MSSGVEVQNSITTMETTIGDLSPEMLMEIFSHYVKSEGQAKFLKNVVPVCSTWWKLSSTASLWKNVSMESRSHCRFRHMEKLNCLLSVSKRGLLHHTRSLKLPRHSDCDADDEDYNTDNMIQVTLYPTDLVTVLSSIHDLKVVDIGSNCIDENTMIIIAKHCPNLQYLRMEHVCCCDGDPITLKELDPILTRCGPTLKRLKFKSCELRESRQSITAIAAKCPSLEEFEWCNSNFSWRRHFPEFPIYKFMSGCPQLRKLKLSFCMILHTDENDCSGFRDLIAFRANRCHFHGLDVCNLLKNSNNLERLELKFNRNIVFSDVSKIPFDNLKFLKIRPKLMT